MSNKKLQLLNIVKKRDYIEKITILDISRNKFTIIDYNEPEIKDMAIIIVFYNFTKSIRIIQNLLLVKNTLEKAKIPFYIAEISLFDNFSLNKADNIFQYRTNSIMFYKENLINLVEKQIPSTFTKILTMDADLLFDNPDWYQLISEILNKYTICQCFSIAHWLSLDFNIYHYKQSVLINKEGHPGFAWAFNREWLKENNLLDICIIGSGDTMLKNSLLDINPLSNYKYLFNGFSNYKNKIKETFTLNNVDINIYHLYHGSFKNRQYNDRHEIINNFIQNKNLNSVEDLLISTDNKLYEWKDEYKNELNSLMINYFTFRDDDSL